MKPNSDDYDIERSRVTRYFRSRGFLFWVLPYLLVVLLATPMYHARLTTTGFLWFCLFYVYFVVAAVLIFWIAKKRAYALRYWLEGSTLRVDEGIVFLRRKSIPLDRITDVALVQGPVMRWCGIWALHIQTAGSPQPSPEGILYGVTNAEQARDALMAARDRAAMGKKTAE